MKAKPMRRCRRPVYPTRQQVLADPALLRQNLPSAWRMPAMAGAVAVFLTANTTVKAADKGAVEQSKAVAVVAPIFVHGEGRGADGCVVVNPPVFLSEQEALQVIKEELAKAGVNLVSRKEEENEIKFMREATWHADSQDNGKKVKVEFVSQFDHTFLEIRKEHEEKPNAPLSMESVSSYDFPKMAKYFAERVAKEDKGKVHIGTFYDPLAGKMDFRRNKSEAEAKDWEANWKEARTKATNESKRLLRLQAQDFVKWLQGQGVI